MLVTPPFPALEPPLPRTARAVGLCLALGAMGCNAILGMDERQPYPSGGGGSGASTGGGGSGGQPAGGGGTGGSNAGGGGTGGTGVGGDPCASPFEAGMCLPREGCVLATGCNDVALLLHFDNDPTFGETASQAHDFSANENNATCLGDCPAHAPSFGRFGGSYEFEPDQHLSVSHHPSISFDNELSVAVWFYPREYHSDWRPLVAKVGAPLEANYWLGHYGDHYCVLFNAAGNWLNECSTLSYPTDEWYLVVGTWDDPNSVFRAYVNGSLVAEQNPSEDMPEVTGDLTIGLAPGDAGVNGFIDEVIVWNRLLTTDEIEALYSPP